MIEDLTAAEVDRRLRSNSPPLLVDVRETWERQVAAIPGSLHIPMGEVPARVTQLPTDRDLVLHCHHGARSLQVAQWLAAQGFDRLANMDGGIDAWSATVDPSLPTY
ncbi:MAG: rhodanese-like domain-containing protein [Actinomycetota bacterium]|jgi:rhodanese-related sulfurtransferase|nr:rhodanese-like domain-containing protein [Actinomycetota bacterium]MDQ3344575.1 rhodanese-like domain-containing protein [Actinomycetota bacterium]